ncbi:MAG: hypothetical protein J5798_09310 [Spirochaetaceae bacterium]|nr:hypothetical protein [Spirochaetaceae bacterium]
MKDKNVKNLEENSFKNIWIDWIGKVQGFYFDVQDKQDSEDELIISFNFAQNSQRSRLFEYFDSLQQNDKISEYSLNQNVISIIYKEKEEENVIEFLKGIVTKIIEIDGKCICNNCDCTENLAYYTNGNKFSLLCNKCGEDLERRFELDQQKENNYIKGFFASLIGALIGSILWIIIGSLGFFASIAGLAISFCAFKGYDIAKGKLTRTGIILNVITIIIAFLFAQYAVLYIEFMKEFKDMTLLGFIFITPIFLKDLEFMQSLLPNIGLGILFIFLGSHRTISNNYKAAKNAENLHIEKLDL